MKPRVLQPGGLPTALEARLTDRYDVHKLVGEADSKAFLAARGAEFVAVATSASTGASPELLAALPNLRVISSMGVGLDKIDVEGARARGIAVGYTPDVLNDCVADLAMALLLDVARRVSEADRFVRRDDWSRAAGSGSAAAGFPLARKVSGAKLGIFGLGRIGQTIARRASGFDMQIRYHSRRPVPAVAWKHELSLVELARWADFLVVATAGGSGTYHLVNADVLDALGPSGFIINVARGSVIDEIALVTALTGKRIAGAALDVFEREPEVPAKLLSLDNVVLVPHIASATREARQAMADLMFDNLHAHFAGIAMPAPAP